MQQIIKDYSFGNTIAYTVEPFQPTRKPKPIAFGSLLLKKDIFLEYQKELKNNQSTKFERAFNIIQNNKEERIQRLLKILAIKKKRLNKEPRKLYKENVNFLESIFYPKKVITDENIAKCTKKIKAGLRISTSRKFKTKLKKKIKKCLSILSFPNEIVIQLIKKIQEKKQKKNVKSIKTVAEIYNQLQKRLNFALVIRQGIKTYTKKKRIFNIIEKYDTAQMSRYIQSYIAKDLHHNRYLDYINPYFKVKRPGLRHLINNRNKRLTRNNHLYTVRNRFKVFHILKNITLNGVIGNQSITYSNLIKTNQLKLSKFLFNRRVQKIPRKYQKIKKYTIKLTKMNQIRFHEINLPEFFDWQTKITQQLNGEC